MWIVECVYEFQTPKSIFYGRFCAMRLCRWHRVDDLLAIDQILTHTDKNWKSLNAAHAHTQNDLVMRIVSRNRRWNRVRNTYTLTQKRQSQRTPTWRRRRWRRRFVSQFIHIMGSSFCFSFSIVFGLSCMTFCHAENPLNAATSRWKTLVRLRTDGERKI